VTTEQLTDGRWIDEGATDEVLLNVAYATTKSLAVGSTLPINGTDYEVVGLVRPTLTGSTADVYFPLATMQQLSGKDGRVTQVSVRVDKAANVAKVTKAIQQLLPGAEVVTAASLADQVSGSLADAHDLAGRFGGILAVIVLLAAVSIAALLTLGSVAKRVREIGTLRAIGWSRGRVVRQIVGETAGIGLIGGVLGIGVGLLVAAGVGAIAPSLSATTAGVPGVGSGPVARLFGQAQEATTSTIELHAAVRPSTLLLGLVFALLGGLVAGAIGSWRAARLAPAVALRDLG
jgi:ABC-type antimicrobial peptide transport system permease subunit